VKPGRAFLILGGTLVCAATVWIALTVYRGQADPDGRGISPRSLNSSATSHLESALRILDDPSSPAPERLAAYREELRRAEDLLLRSLAAQPAQARTLARLAAVRFELDPPLSPEDDARFLAMIRAASEMAPRVPAVQVQLGELLFRLGREDDAWTYLARAVELDPTVAPDAVATPLASYVPPERVRRALPAVPEVLVVLERSTVERGDPAAYLGAVEGMLDRATPRLLAAYGNVALRAREPARLLAGLERVGERDDPSLEVERLVQRSRARQATGDLPGAIEDARAARGLFPEVPRFAEHLGVLSAAAGRNDDAIAAYREALSHVARGSGRDRDRARLYRLIGQAEEAAHRPAKAYEAYKRAVAADAGEGFAGRKVREMEGAVGAN
jgi:tetratricopeptide (TPR) repeat protein